MAQSDQKWNAGCACSCPVGLRHLQAHGPVLLVDLTIEREREDQCKGLCFILHLFFSHQSTPNVMFHNQVFGNSSLIFSEDLENSGLAIVICKSLS